MKIIALSIALLSFSFGVSQSITTDQKLVSTLGGKSINSNNIEFSYSIGEPIIFRGSANGKTYTQGFQQPNDKITFSVDQHNISCVGANDGSIIISDINGCQGPYTLSINGDVQNSLFVNGLAPGVYLIEVSNAVCTSEKEIILEDGAHICTLHFFNGFTPNNDGTNDSWVIKNITVSPYGSNSIAIYNRWGNIVWEGQNYNNEEVSFLGKDMKGNDLSDGTYFYVASINDQEYTGYIQLMR